MFGQVYLYVKSPAQASVASAVLLMCVGNRSGMMVLEAKNPILIVNVLKTWLARNDAPEGGCDDG